MPLDIAFLYGEFLAWNKVYKSLHFALRQREQYSNSGIPSPGRKVSLLFSLTWGVLLSTSWKEMRLSMHCMFSRTRQTFSTIRVLSNTVCDSWSTNVFSFAFDHLSEDDSWLNDRGKIYKQVSIPKIQSVKFLNIYVIVNTSEVTSRILWSHFTERIETIRHLHIINTRVLYFTCPTTRRVYFLWWELMTLM